MPVTNTDFDYIILGGGTAGCVLANRLSVDPAIRVLMIEAGGKDDYFWLKVPLGLPYILGNPVCDWRFQSEPEPFCNNRVIPLPRGKTLGGSSSINGMVYVRGHALDYERWRQDGNIGWGWDDVLPYFKRGEDYFGGASATRGAGGELSVVDPGVRWEILDAYIDACVEAGIPLAADYNSGDNEGVAYFQAMIRAGQRCSTSQGFLRPVTRRPNLAVITGAIVERLVFEGRQCVGVEYRAGGESRRARAARETILCAGAFGSPQILQMSGVGAGALLRERGVGVVHDLPGVGENLQDHWMVRVQHRVENTRTLNAWTQNALGKMSIAARYFLARRGPMAAQPALLAAFARTREGLDIPDVQIHVAAASYAVVGGPMHPFAGITSSACILRPTSRGHVRIRSADAMEQPAILHNYLQTTEDQDVALRAIALVRRIAAQPAMQKFIPRELQPLEGLRDDAALLDYARNTVTTVFHPTSTCIMGRGAGAVVDDSLRVHGIGGLRIADASIMPTITSGNTCAPVIMIAEKAADLIRWDTRRSAAA